MTTTEHLDHDAAGIMMKAAAEYLHRHAPEGGTDLDLVVAALQRRTPQAVEDALRDAKEALDAGMPQIASVTFRLTIQLAGYNAARDVLEPGWEQADIPAGG